MTPAAGDLDDDQVVGDEAIEPALPQPPAGPVEALDAEQQARRARIVAAAVALFLSRDYDQIQMKDVTAAAGVALRTTYRYFTSKDHLFGEALEAWAGDYPIPPSAETGRAVDLLKSAFHRAVRAFEPHPSAYHTIAIIQASKDPWARHHYRRFADRQTEAFERYLPRLAPERRTAVVGVMSAVLDVHLRAWSMGQVPVATVHHKIDEAADLLLA